MKQKLLLALLALFTLGGSNLFAQQEPVDEGVYYLYNVETGKFLTRGSNWGTQAVTNDFGQPWKVKISDGKYTLHMLDISTADGNDNRGLDNAGYADNGGGSTYVMAWTLGGSQNGYTLSDGNIYVVSPDQYGQSVLGDADGNKTWQFLDIDEYKTVLAAKTTAQEAAVATSAGIDITGSNLASFLSNADAYTTKDMSSSIPFPSNSTWTQVGVSNRGGAANEGTYGVERYQGGGTYSYTATGLLPGIYKVGIKAMFRSTSNAACLTVGKNGYVNSSAYLSANGNLVQIKDWYSSHRGDADPNSTGSFVEIANGGGYYSEVYTYVGEDGKLELKAVSESYWVASWFLFNGITLTYYSNQVSDEDAEALIASIPTDKMSDAAADRISVAKAAFEADKTIANYNALQAAIDAAAVSIAEYKMIDAGSVPTNNVAGWAKSTSNGDIACNTWSTEGNSDGSGMTTPFIQDWVASGTALGAGKLYYTFQDLTPGETYMITALVRAFNEEGTGVSGVSFFAGNNSKSIIDFGATCAGDFAAKGMFATLSCAGTVDSNGKLQFGIEVADGSPVNWISIKNVKIAKGTGEIPTVISLNQNSASITTGSTLNLQATITPETADDKTITWTSSNPGVATVSGGYVVAVASGTATITANAYAGNNVTASCTVTVTDAAAPSFFTTDLQNGVDYYIYNAATGKYLGGANSWGTQASLIEHGIPFTVALTDDKYTLDSHTYNNANDHFFSGTYVDGSSTNLYITSVGNGKYSISTADGSAFVTATPGSTVVANTAVNANSVLAQWYFLSKTDRDKMLAAATAEKPADATYYIKQANISRNLSSGNQGENAWNGLSTGGEQDNTNFVAQVYNASVDVSQTIDNIPNGTYSLSMQGFTSGTDVKLYANDVEVDVRANDSGAASCSAAAALFAQKKYPNTLTVTVTDRTLKIGLKGDCSSAKWLCFDDFELMMTNYVPVTGVTATLEEDVQIGQTATITAATVPAEASFNKLTFASADESIATVDENGVVTGIAVGETTITVTANEMENFSTTVNVAVTLVTPTALTMSEEEVELNSENTSATLTVTATPAGANNVVKWSSSDESVATVNDGVVTGISTGTATITATSIVDSEVTATATVTVTYPESTVPETSYENDGATRTVFTLGENLIKNGVFEYPDAFYSWTSSNDFKSKITSDNFTIKTDNDGQKYLVGTKNTGAAGVGSLGTAWKLEQGKTYQFAYDVKKEGNGTDFTYLKTSLVSSPSGDESKTTSRILGYPSSINSTWTTITYNFTAGENENYLQVSFRWLNNQWGFRNFRLTEVSTTTEGNVDYVKDAIPTANIGENAFQYSQEAIDAANALVQGEATVEDVTNAYNAVTTVNAPAEGQLFNVVLTYDGWTYDNKAMTYIANGRTDGGNYNIQYKEEANQNLAQAFTFTKVEGNNYKMSQIDADGVARYITTGVPYGGNTAQIRTTTDETKALAVTVIPTVVEGKWNLRNTEANQFIGSQDAGVYTVNSHIDFKLVETQKPSIAINTTAAGWGTTILPFAAQKPADVKVYTCAKMNGTDLVLTEVETLEANKPYIIEGAWNETLTGDAQGTELNYTEGLLTGVYAQTEVAAGTYVMQMLNGKVAFYQVSEEKPINVPANRAYLTVNSEAKVLNIGNGETNGINAIQALIDGDAEIFNVNGVKQNTLQKGINIIKMSNGETRKIMVK